MLFQLGWPRPAIACWGSSALPARPSQIRPSPGKNNEGIIIIVVTLGKNNGICNTEGIDIIIFIDILCDILESPTKLLDFPLALTVSRDLQAFSL